MLFSGSCMKVNNVSTEMAGLTIKDQGLNNNIYIEDGSVFELSQVLIEGDHNNIYIGRSNIYGKLSINIKGNGKEIKIGSSSKNIRGLKVVSIRGDHQKFIVGNNFGCGGFELQMNDGEEGCYIGNDCLFSWGIKARTSDGHSVVDLSTNKAINLPKDIHIGNKVWVGEDVHFLKGSGIGNDCVVASCSVVTKMIVADNSLIGGYPAKILRDNISWDRKPAAEYNRKSTLRA